LYTADDLRSDIRQAELFVANLKPGTPADDLLGFFQLLDTLVAQYDRLERQGVDLRAELSRLETVQNILVEKDRIVTRVLGLESLRAEIHPPRDHYWWYLDQRVAQRKSRRLRRLAWGSLIGALILALLTVLYVRFLRPDEATRRRIEYTFEGDASIQAGEYAAALESYQKALEFAPDDPEINLTIGVLSEALEKTQEAKAAYARAEQLYGSRAVMLSMRAQQYSTLGWYDRAEADALEAIELDEQFPLAYCSLGSAFEGQDQVPQAIVAFQACADKAREQEQNELYVIATTRLAYLMQRP
jgi:tetratricopeptide (TPR) repeat protein